MNQYKVIVTITATICQFEIFIISVKLFVVTSYFIQNCVFRIFGERKVWQGDVISAKLVTAATDHKY